MANGFTLAWRQVGAWMILLCACGMIASTYSIIAVPLNEEFRPSRMVLMLAITILSAAGAIISPIAGNFMDRTSMRLLAGLGTALLACGFLAMSFATSFYQILAIYGLFMASANVLIGPIAATVSLSRWFVQRRSRAIGIAIMGISLGPLAFPPIVQALLESLEWREAMRVFALIIALFTFPAVALIVDRPSDRKLHADGAAVDQGTVHAQPAGARISVGAILSDPTFWLAATVFSVVMSGIIGMVSNIATLAIDEGLSAANAASLISIFAGASFIAKIIFATFADRINPRMLLLISLLGFAAGMAGMVQAQHGYWAIAASVVLVGFFGGLTTPMQNILITRIFSPLVIGKASGLMGTVVLCALLSTPPLFGLIFDLTGDYDAIFMTFAALAALAMLLVPYIRMHPREIVSPGPFPDAQARDL